MEGQDWSVHFHPMAEVYLLYDTTLKGKDGDQERESMAVVMTTILLANIVLLETFLPSTKVFIWRAAQGILPTYANLLSRHIGSHSDCPICKCPVESILHALWECPAAKDVFCASTKKLQKMEGDFSGSFTQFWGMSTMVLSQRDQAILAITMRCIWHRRNKFIHDNVFIHPTQIAQQCILTADEFASAQSTMDDSAPSLTSVVDGGEGWKGPPNEFVKANWDAAIDKKGNCTGIGVIFRDTYGDLLACT
ncbi:uncharacterized protein LOC120007267 [Tripterygium wilfordii]|uniref:uncharacterized protein LOC120007267 n=1 Tax=Tripterygium wilfordii TaxID=458696 RepID=UPI0018F81FF9|nr:uncharacterized protein LOC120007267 [Tripterygium wilfordii]